MCFLDVVTSQAQLAVVSSAETGGPTPEQLVGLIIDPTGIQLVPGTVTTIINAPNNDPPNPPSNLRAMGSFTGGLTPAGTLLPPENQNSEGNAAYSGGIGIASGVCLCTGLATDDDPQVDPQSVPEGLGVGVEGPNNGHPLGPLGVIGEIDFELDKPADADFNVEVPSFANGDATVLNFDIQLLSPGILQIRYVHATDEHPFFSLSSFNDTFLVFVRNPRSPNSQLKNFVVFRARNSGTGEVEEKKLSLEDLQACGFLKNNLVAPSPAALLQSRHADFNRNFIVDEADLANPRYDHEFGGFSKPLTFEAISPLSTSPLYRHALAPGVYNIKMVIQDVGDGSLDSAAFIAANSLKLFSLAQGDYNGSGCVDSADYDVWRANYGRSPATFYQGDGNGDGTVDSADYVVWRNNEGASGNTDFRADFNRDGQVSSSDLAILAGHHNELNHCASRFEGDADGVATSTMPISTSCRQSMARRAAAAIVETPPAVASH